MAIHDPSTDLLHMGGELKQLHTCLEHEKGGPKSNEKTATQRISALRGATHDRQGGGPCGHKC
jgi:hypothetical protein